MVCWSMVTVVVIHRVVDKLWAGEGNEGLDFLGSS
jgi:hypothetical protein